MNLQLVVTKDGSHSLFSENFHEHYHSIHGALTESKHVFINAGLKSLAPYLSVNILEIGFGTGLNCFLTALENDYKRLEYTSVEAYPVKKEIWEKLNYPEILANDQSELFKKIHESEWHKKVQLNSNFSLTKIHSKLGNIELRGNFNLVYFDAFSPEKQPGLWTIDIFEKINNLMDFGGILVTYCAKGSVRRAMKEVGFDVIKLPGPPGKREMLRATKSKVW